jgi:hypothetical protein
MKARIQGLWFLLVMASGFMSHATVYQGTISGQITLAEDASFLMFGGQTPLLVGTPISGHYSYEGATLDGSLFTFLNPQFTMNIGPEIVLSSCGLFALCFEVSGGQFSSLYYDLDSNFFPGQESYMSRITASQDQVFLGEMVDAEPIRIAQGSLVFSEPVPVPDGGPAWVLLLFALAMLRHHRKRHHRA